MEVDMTSLDEIINESRDVREVKRALSVKMVHQGISPEQISTLLNVSLQYISKWKVKYALEGVDALFVSYQGSKSYLTQEQKQEILQWVAQHSTLKIEEIIVHIEEKYQVIYQSKQSYYDLLEQGGMSYHRSEPVNPRHNTARVLVKREEIKKNFWHIKKKLLQAK
jgi:putative transposase